MCDWEMCDWEMCDWEMCDWEMCDWEMCDWEMCDWAWAGSGRGCDATEWSCGLAALELGFPDGDTGKHVR